MRNPQVDVVVLTWNDTAQAEQAVASALVSEGVEVRVVVVDNASERPFVSDDPNVLVERAPRNLGVAGGRNAGAGLTSASLVCFLDSDARLHPGGLRRLVEPLLRDETIGLTCPVFDDQPPEDSAGRAPGFARKAVRGLGLTKHYASTGPHEGLDAWEVEFGIGACQVFRRVCFDAVGGLDEADLFGPEDVDFCVRIGRQGWRLVQVAGSTCVHPPRRRHRRLFTRRGLRHARGVVRYLWRKRSHPRAERFNGVSR